jgi:hypothetical protein
VQLYRCMLPLNLRFKFIFIKFIQKYQISGAYVPEDKILKNNCLLIMPLCSWNLFFSYEFFFSRWSLNLKVGVYRCSRDVHHFNFLMFKQAQITVVKSIWSNHKLQIIFLRKLISRKWPIIIARTFNLRNNDLVVTHHQCKV